jgi:serine/threonine protein kinase
MREVESLVKLRHPRIIRILRWALGGDSSGGEIHMEFAENGSLRSLLDSIRERKVSPMTATRKARIICDIVMGMRYVHRQGIIHCDLKPPNILLDENWRAKIGDFGVSRPVSAQGPMTGNAATLGYAAPEQIYEEVAHTTKTDVFAFGLVVYEIVSGDRVFGEFEPSCRILERLRDRRFPAIPASFGNVLQNLIVRCWAADQRARPSFEQILKIFQVEDFRILPGADAEELRKSVDDE